MADDDTESEANGEGANMKNRTILDRQRAMLTKTDRELLLDNKEYDSDQGLRNARHRLREHVRNSLLDAFAVSTLIETDELEQIVERHEQLRSEGDTDPILLSAGALELAIRIMYIEATQINDYNPNKYVESQIETEISSVLERQDDQFITEVDVDIDVTKREKLDNIIDDLINGEPTLGAVSRYIMKFGSEPIQSTLRKKDMKIETSGGIVIGPSSEIFDDFY